MSGDAKAQDSRTDHSRLLWSRSRWASPQGSGPSLRLSLRVPYIQPIAVSPRGSIRLVPMQIPSVHRWLYRAAQRNLRVLRYSKSCTKGDGCVSAASGHVSAQGDTSFFAAFPCRPWAPAESGKRFASLLPCNVKVLNPFNNCQTDVSLPPTRSSFRATSCTARPFRCCHEPQARNGRRNQQSLTVGTWRVKDSFCFQSPARALWAGGFR